MLRSTKGSTALVVGLVALGLRLASAEDRRLVPEVIDLPAEAAEQSLVANGFVVARRPVPGRPAGTVARQSPGGFRWALPGATVTIDVRQGDAPSAPAAPGLADVRGRTEAEALETLREYRVHVRVEESAAADEGRVVRQEPAAGTALPRGGAVTLVVGRRGAPAAGTSLVPSVVGLTQERASQLLTASQLAPVVVPAASSPADAGKVLSQDPAGGTVVARQSNVTITVGREVIGPLMESEVPALTGLADAEARARLDRAGLTAAVGYVLAPDSAGRVVSQDPAPGTRLLRGRPVALRVGVAMLLPTSVPDVVGLAAADAERALVEAGFSVEVGSAVALAGSAGRVVSQEPAGGTSALRGTTVRIVVGRSASAPPVGMTGTPSVPVPSLVGHPEDYARTHLELVGFSVEVEPVAGPAEEVGRVKEQLPLGSASAPRGSVVRLKVVRANAPPRQAGGLPSYVGMDLAAVQSDLSARGLVGMTRSVPGTPAGRVVQQAPPAGTAVPPGSVVELTVSHGAAGLVPPVLVGPPSGNAAPRAYGVTFQWQPVQGAEDYQIEVMVLKGDTWVVADNDVVSATTKRPSHVKRGKYRWHVRARRDGGKSPGPWSEWSELSIY